MGHSLDTLVDVLKTAGEPTRFRLLDRSEPDLPAEIAEMHRRARHRVLELLTGLIEDELSVAEIVEKGQGRFDRALVKRVERLVLLAEYKRRQAAPGVKLTVKAFGIGRKYPITNGYRDESDVMVREQVPEKQGVQ